MDIRKYFTSPTSSHSHSFTNNAGKNESSKQVTPKRSKSKKRRIIESDSDEDPLPKATNKKEDISPKNKNVAKSKIQEPPSETRKVVSISSFFGSSPVNRTNAKSHPVTKNIKEACVHGDDDFEATLRQLDAASNPKKKEEKQPKVNGSSETELKKTKDKSPSQKRKTKAKLSKIEIMPTEKASPKEEIKDDKPAAKRLKGSGGAMYASYLAREGPRSLGSKEIPEGEEDCLAGLTFLITGILESFERDEAKSVIEKYGGKVMSTLSAKTMYMIVGRDAGSSKLEKAEKFKTKQLDEDGLLDLIRTLPGKNGTPKQLKKSKEKQSPTTKSQSCIEQLELTQFKQEIKVEKIDSSSNINMSPEVEINETKSPVDSVVSQNIENLKNSTMSNYTMPSMWVDKYKPSTLKQLIGQQGDKSNAKKLLHWLVNWHKNRRLNKKAITGRFNPSDDGGGFKAALLSGPPGVGKTTTAQLVCKEACYDLYELNASDTRSKKGLQATVSQLLGNQTLADCLKEGGKVSKNHVIVMDEVDGMAGNEDRGGMMELIGFIKASKIPIICICNDRNHQKIRSLANHCFDLRFQRPRVEQIKAAMMSIAFKEHIKVTPDVLQDVIVSSNQDIRQILHNMSMWSASSNCLSKEQTKDDIGRGTKHIKMSPFDVLREVFAIGNNPKATFIDKSDLFFHDYSLAPLFVQENYAFVHPKAAEGDKKKHLTLLSEAADSICIGDIIDKQIRSTSSWSLLPTQAIFASVVPGELLRGNLQQMINFPAWLGKNSSRSHMDRVLQELHVHMRMKITGNKTDVAMEYLPLLKHALTEPLIKKENDGIGEVLKTMEEYYLLREDFDSIIDLSLWSKQIDPRTKIITKVKGAFTRAYNKESGKNPYSVSNVKKKKGSSKATEDDIPNEDEEAGESEEDDDVEKDAMIKVKKPAKKSAKQNEPSVSNENKKNKPKKGKGK